MKGRAFAVLAALVLAFLWTPLTRGGYYAGADILQHFQIFREGAPAWAPQNDLIGDTVLVMFPALAFDVAEVRSGRLPLLNPHNGWGVPHLAAFQSAVFSPYTVPYYLLPFRAAILVATFLKLFGFGALTWLFLRRIGCRPEAALLGAVIFMFGGYNVLWLHSPLSSAVLVIPAGMYLGEVALQTAPGPRRGLALVAFTAALAAGLLAGHPETYFFGSLLVGAWLLYRVAGLDGRGRRLAEFAACAAGALAASAVQLVPFFEYMAHSTALAERARLGFLFHVNRRLLALAAFPNLLGKPGLPFADTEAFLYSNYIEANAVYAGGTALLLGAWAVSTWARGRSRHTSFFAAAGLAWVLFAYDVGGLARLAHHLPFFSITMPNRSQPVWIFCLASLAALGTEAAFRRPPSRRAAVEALGFCAVLIAAALAAALFTYTIARDTAATLGFEIIPPSMAAAHVGLVALTMTAAALALAAVEAGRFRRIAAFALTATVFLQTGFLLRSFNPTIPDALFYPQTLALRHLARDKGALTLFAGEAWLPANANAFYGLRSVEHYDGMGVRVADTLKGRLLGPRPGFPRATLRGLQVLGIGRVAGVGPEVLGGRVPELVTRGQVGPIAIHEVPGTVPRFSTVGRALPVPDDEAALETMLAPAFDPSADVVLHDGAAGGGGRSPGTLTVLADSPTHARLRVERAAPGWVLALHSPLPGWTATVSGREARVARANVGFMAVPVPAGASEVELRYRPASVRMGAAVSLAAAAGLAMAALALFAARRPRLL